MYDIIVVGAGPAGLTAAIYGVRGGKTVLMIEKLSYGGQIINTPEVENYPGTGIISGFQLATDMYEQATKLGAELDFGEVNGIEKLASGGFKVTTDGGQTHEAKSIILATGVKSRPLGVDNEEKLTGAGISYCATCDGAFFRNKDVAIMGGGNTALEDAEYMSTLANKVYLIHRRDKFRGDQITVDRLSKKENVEFIFDSVASEVKGETKVESLVLENTKTGEIREVNVQGVFVAYGHIAQNDAFAELTELDSTGFFTSGEDCMTKSEGIFVAGDCRAKSRRQLVTATSDGAVAAMNAIDYLNAHE
ncbi:MAG: thioredoxin-disulfide reductase [Eubacterium sp.]|nr:thioredoxin-disulfide reductase [Eubacterium sp.]